MSFTIKLKTKATANLCQFFLFISTTAMLSAYYTRNDKYDSSALLLILVGSDLMASITQSEHITTKINK